MPPFITSRRKRKTLGKGLIYLLLLLSSAVVIFPYLWMALTSFKPIEEFFTYPAGLAHEKLDAEPVCRSSGGPQIPGRPSKQHPGFLDRNRRQPGPLHPRRLWADADADPRGESRF